MSYCARCSLELTQMGSALVCVCCGGGEMAPDRGCRHGGKVFQFQRITPLVLPFSCEDLEPEG